MLLLPPQSPNRVPVTGKDIAPAKLISLKSISVTELMAAQVNVRCVPTVFDASIVRYEAAVPAFNVNVPLIVWFAPMVKIQIPALVLPALVKLLNVFAPVIDRVNPAVLVKERL